MDVIEVDFYASPPRVTGKMRRAPIKVDLRWPNQFGDGPEDALGKHVYLEMPVGRGEFEVWSIADGKLVLRPFP
jgi:hypothetical protein